MEGARAMGNLQGGGPASVAWLGRWVPAPASLLEAVDGGWPARLIALVTTALLLTTRANPLLLMIMGGTVFIAWRWVTGA